MRKKIGLLVCLILGLVFIAGCATLRPTPVLVPSALILSNIKQYMRYVKGTDKGPILLVTLSDCPHCNATKAFLNNSGVAYWYYDLDRGDPRSNQLINQAVMDVCGFAINETPVIIAKDECTIGYNEQRLKDVSDNPFPYHSSS